MRTIVLLSIIFSSLVLNVSTDEKPPAFSIEKAIEEKTHLGIYRFINPTNKLMGCLVKGTNYNLAIIIQPMTMAVWYYKRNCMKHSCMEMPAKIREKL